MSMGNGHGLHLGAHLFGNLPGTVAIGVGQDGDEFFTSPTGDQVAGTVDSIAQ